MGLVQDLNTLDEKLIQAKTQLADNLTAKGVPSTVDDTLTAQAAKVLEIKSGSTSGIDFSALGYTDETQYMKDSIDYSKQIKDGWDSSVTDLNFRYHNDKLLRYFPKVDTSQVTNMYYMFGGSNLEILPDIDTSKVENMSFMFDDCNCLTVFPAEIDCSSCTTLQQCFGRCKKLKNIKLIHTSKVTDLSYSFQGASEIETIEIDDISACTTFKTMFSSAGKLTSITLHGRLLPDADISRMFNGWGDPCVLYYDKQYEADFQRLIETLPSFMTPQAI